AMPNSAPNPTPAPAQSNEKVLNVPVIWQGNTMLCEGASMLEGLHYKGVATNQNLTSFVTYMPRANDHNPYHGYSGEWRCN
ncbi:C39 family peptidase, partial [Enterococcus faecium]